jgi:hypothetical protein
MCVVSNVRDHLISHGRENPFLKFGGDQVTKTLRMKSGRRISEDNYTTCRDRT